MIKIKLLRAEEVALLTGITTKTLSFWYKWKETEKAKANYPEFIELLPPYIQKSNRGTRYWKESDLWKLIEFKSKIPQGKNGIMGNVTQKYAKNRKETQNNE